MGPNNNVSGAFFAESNTVTDGFIGDSKGTKLVNTYPSPGSGSGSGLYTSLGYFDPISNELMKVVGDTWINDRIEEQHRSHSEELTVFGDVEEDKEIRLVHALLTCAESIQHGELQLASSLVGEITNELLTRVNTSSGIGKVACYFIDALSQRLYPSSLASQGSLPNDVLYHYFYEACPYLKFAHFTANQAILESFEGHTSVHVIDFSLMHGLQWPALIQALALRPGGPPSLRLTAVSLPSFHGHPDSFRETGIRLTQLARSINVTFSFRVVTIPQLDSINPWIFQTSPEEVVAVNSILQFHQLLGSDINPILKSIQRLNPKIVTIVEQEANHNQPEFLIRFTEALHYYSAMFDSLEACHLEATKPVAETYMQREICNILCCEGSARVERHEPLAKWQLRLSSAGFKALPMGHNALKQANMLLTLCSGDGYCVQENDGCLSLGWHNRPLIVASAWQTKIENDDGSSSSSSS
ncbi:unnamed protein product [Amaranthus hypochondriacus]